MPWGYNDDDDDDGYDWREQQRQEKEEAYDRWYAEKQADDDARAGIYDRTSYSATAWDTYEPKWHETEREVRWEREDRERRERDEQYQHDRQERWEREESERREQRDYDYDYIVKEPSHSTDFSGVTNSGSIPFSTGYTPYTVEQRKAQVVLHPTKHPWLLCAKWTLATTVAYVVAFTTIGATNWLALFFGAIIGFGQYLILQHEIYEARSWFWRSGWGWIGGSVLFGLVAMNGFGKEVGVSVHTVGETVLILIALGVTVGLLIGLLQGNLLHQQGYGRGLWIFACVTGWALGLALDSILALALFYNFDSPVVTNQTPSMRYWVIHGVINGSASGVVTGLALTWLLQRSSAKGHQSSAS